MEKARQKEGKNILPSADSLPMKWQPGGGEEPRTEAGMAPGTWRCVRGN